jgi:hypothetical protein
MQPQPPQPLAHQQFWRWFSHLSRRTQIIGCGVLLFSCVICTTVSAIIGKSNQTTPVAVATASPTQAPPTAAPTTAPTATPKPTPTATPKPRTMDQQVNDAMQNAGMLGKHLKTSYSRSDKSVTVSDDIGDGNLTNSLTVEEIKLECFNAQKALWTHLASQLSDVTVSVTMNVVDQYGNQSNSEVASCDLQKSTEQKFNWNNLYPDLAWQDYDFQYIAPFLTQ